MLGHQNSVAQGRRARTAAPSAFRTGPTFKSRRGTSFFVHATQCVIQRRELWIFWARTHRRLASGNLHIWIYGYTTFHTDIFPSKKVVENQPSRPSMQGQGIRRAHTAALPWLYHAPQAQPCLSYVEICIGLMLVADLAWVCVCVGRVQTCPFCRESFSCHARLLNMEREYIS